MKSQVSMEYLAVYGFGIAIILGTIATFVYIGGNPEDRIPSDCKFGVEIDCIDHEVVSNDRTKVYLLNKEEDIHRVKLICDYNGEISESIVLNKINKSQEFLLECSTASQIKSGERVNIDLTIEYDLNLTKMRNPRYYHGSLITKAK